MTDPHKDDYCVICDESPSVEGPVMHPVVSIKNGVLCDTHVTERKDSASYGGSQ